MSQRSVKAICRAGLMQVIAAILDRTDTSDGCFHRSIKRTPARAGVFSQLIDLSVGSSLSRIEGKSAWAVATGPSSAKSICGRRSPAMSLAEASKN